MSHFFHPAPIRPRRFVLWFLCAALGVLPVAVAALVLWTDPLQNWRASEWIMGDERYIMPGLARHQDYDTVAVGTSLAQNFTRSPTASVLGGKVINLSISGGTLFEVRQVLDVALRTGQVQRVLWGIDDRETMMSVETRAAGYPYFFYDDNPFNDVQYVYNLSVVQTAVAKLLSPGHSRLNLENMMAWYRNPRYRPGRAKVLREIAGDTALAAIPGATAPDAGTDPRLLVTAADNIDRNVLLVIRAHPEVRFDIFVPPFSTLHHALMARLSPGTFSTSVAILESLVTKLLREPNVTLHFFGDFAGVADNLDNYKDTSHYSVAVSHRILHEVRQGSYRLTPENYRTRLDAWVAHVRAYDLDRDLSAVPPP
ncbi:MAG: hypothetical protein OEW11_06290 [Nitrospirota bacterium]|nr:hypothetical protein [Nitrospirota bacterium]